MTKRTLFAATLAAVALVAVPGSAPAGNDGVAPAAPQSKGGPNAKIEEQIGAQVPLDVAFEDEDRQPITLRTCIAGKPTILVPMYYRCPMLCNEILENLIDALRRMPPDFSVGGPFNVVCVSIDPRERMEWKLAANKRQKVLEAYGRAGAEPGWRFLTGTKESIAALTEAVGYRFEFDKVFKEYNHPSGIIILTPEGKVARYFYGIDYERVFELEKGGTTTLRLSLVEASDGKIGSLKDKLLLLCYRFDQLHKGYSLSVLRAVQIGGILTLLIVGTVVGLAFRRERRAARAAAASATNGATGSHDTPQPNGAVPPGGIA